MSKFAETKTFAEFEAQLKVDGARMDTEDVVYTLMCAGLFDGITRNKPGSSEDFDVVKARIEAMLDSDPGLANTFMMMSVVSSVASAFRSRMNLMEKNADMMMRLTEVFNEAKANDGSIPADHVEMLLDKVQDLGRFFKKKSVEASDHYERTSEASADAAIGNMKAYTEKMVKHKTEMQRGTLIELVQKAVNDGLPPHEAHWPVSFCLGDDEWQIIEKLHAVMSALKKSGDNPADLDIQQLKDLLDDE